MWCDYAIHLVTRRIGNISFWYVFPPRLVIVAFVNLVIWHFDSVTWSRDQVSCHRYAGYYFILPTKFGLHAVSFLKFWHDNIENWDFKVRQLLQNETETVIKTSLQSATENYCNVLQVLQCVTDNYKVR